MDNNLDIKVANTSRPVIESLQDSRSEFQSMIEKMDTEIEGLSQEVRIETGGSPNSHINRINKLKVHRKRLSDLLTVMDDNGGTTWDLLRPEAQQVFEDALLAWD